jgi:hypothetical protein
MPSRDHQRAQRGEQREMGAEPGQPGGVGAPRQGAQQIGRHQFGAAGHRRTV